MLPEWAKKRLEELKQDILFHEDHGMDIRTAVDIARNSTVISDELFDQLLIDMEIEL